MLCLSGGGPKGGGGREDFSKGRDFWGKETRRGGDSDGSGGIHKKDGVRKSLHPDLDCEW